MPTAKVLPSGRFRVRIYTHTDALGNKHYKSFTADTKREAERLASLYEVDAENNKTNFNARLEEYISSKEAVLSPATIKGYRNIQKQFNNKYVTFGKKVDITKNDVQKLINELSADKSPKTVRNYYGLITASLGKEFDVTLPQRVELERYIPSTTEIKKVIECAKGTELYVPVLLGSHCMMRRGEIAALTMEDIDGNMIHISKDMVLNTQKQWVVKPPKTNSSDRYIPAPPYVIEAIQEQGYITRYNPHTITLMWDRFLNKNGFKHFRFHDLRHFGASYYHSKGIGDAYIQKIGGWKTDKVLKSVYRHTLSDEEKRIAELINEQLKNDFS